MVSIVETMTDPKLFGPTFGSDSFAAWRALLGAFYGLPLDDDQLETFKTLTGREKAPEGAFDELWLAIGRRGGKSHAAALVATFEAAFKDHRAKLAPGEVATVMLLAADRAQARTLLRYVRGLFDHPMLKPLVARETTAGLELTNRSAIEVATASHRAVRGYTLAAVVCDEIAFWHSDGARPDAEVIAALRPALVTLGGKLVAISSPYSKRGELWTSYRRHFGQDDSTRVLVAQAPSPVMNPTIPQHVIDDAIKDDAARASAEWLAQFRADIEQFLSVEVVTEAMRTEPLSLPPRSGIRYFAFVDPSGGGADEFTLAIGHAEDAGLIVVDQVVGRRGNPAAITGGILRPAERVPHRHRARRQIRGGMEPNRIPAAWHRLPGCARRPVRALPEHGIGFAGGSRGIAALRETRAPACQLGTPHHTRRARHYRPSPRPSR